MQKKKTQKLRLCTLHWNGGNQKFAKNRFICSIYPHTQWRNYVCSAYDKQGYDIPSHMVREFTLSGSPFYKFRYTLTYNEGTWFFFLILWTLPIYPHMKWGNQALARLKLNTDDIPSYEMREPVSLFLQLFNLWYTIIWNDGTLSVYAAFSHLKYIVV